MADAVRVGMMPMTPDEFLVHPLKEVERIVDLAANLHAPGNRRAEQSERDVTHRAEVWCDVFANGPVSAGCASHQYALFIQQTDRGAINLELGGISRGTHVLADDPDQTNLPFAQFSVIKRIRQRQHGHRMYVFR